MATSSRSNEAAVVGDLLAGPQPAQHGQGLVELGRPVGPGDALGRQLGPFGQAEHEREQQPATGELVQRGQLLGQAGRVAARYHQMGAELQAAGAAGGEAECGERVERAAGQHLGHPDRVEAESLQLVDQVGEPSPAIGGCRRPPPRSRCAP